MATATVGTAAGDCATLRAMTSLTIREAADSTGHSTHKIRRLIKAIADQPNDVDRHHVEPNPADVERLNAEGVQFTWRISEELVRRRLGDTPSPATPDNHASTAGDSGNVLDLLQRAMTAKEQAESRLFDQLKTKDEQISGLQQTVASLNERLRESNLLMANIQQQLPSPKAEANGEADGGRRPSASHAKPTAAAASPKQAKRKTWLNTIFG